MKTNVTDLSEENLITGEEVTLPEMLNARESRVMRQNELRSHYKGILLCFNMNIAGPVKNNAIIKEGYEIGKKRIKKAFLANKITPVHFEEITVKTGNEAIWVLDADALYIKKIVTEIEDMDALGRLFDMDIIDRDGIKIERSLVNGGARSCIICKKPVRECAGGRVHTVEELQIKTGQILKEYTLKEDAADAASMAVRALLYELMVSPKPGLVDRYNNGSHKDMDCFTFMDSISVIWPYFEKCTKAGRLTKDLDPKETLKMIRGYGKYAEGNMLQATKGINTHKGAIFSLGILCAALGRSSRPEWSETETVLKECSKIASDIIKDDLDKIKPDMPGDANAEKGNNKTLTNGERLYIEHGISGIRGQVQAGFPAVKNYGLPILEEGVKKGLSLNDAGCAALLHIIANETDTNMISRSSLETQKNTAAELKFLLEKDPFPNDDTLKELDKKYISMNLSPGGSADLLAVSYMLYFLKNSI